MTVDLPWYALQVGCEKVLSKLFEWQATIQAARYLGRDPLNNFGMNFRFVGAPSEWGGRLLSMLLLMQRHKAGVGSFLAVHIIMVFTGHLVSCCLNPLKPSILAGTGKTTVARRVGTLFCSLGLLASPDVVECSASNFTTGYAGQSGARTREMFDKALGKVLFIDEAYKLNPKGGGSFMREVCVCGRGTGTLVWAAVCKMQVWYQAAPDCLPLTACP